MEGIVEIREEDATRNLRLLGFSTSLIMEEEIISVMTWGIDTEVKRRQPRTSRIVSEVMLEGMDAILLSLASSFVSGAPDQVLGILVNSVHPDKSSSSSDVKEDPDGSVRSCVCVHLR